MTTWSQCSATTCPKPKGGMMPGTDHLTAKSRIMARLANSDRPLAIHDFQIPGVSQNSLGSRLPELANAGLVVGEDHPSGYKVWRLPMDGEVVRPEKKPRPISIPVVGVKDTLCPGMQILTVSVPQSLSGKKFSYHVEARAI